jgi:hypothetical protein
MPARRQRTGEEQEAQPPVPVRLSPEEGMMGRVPMRRGPAEITEFLGQAFRRQWRTYFRNHEDEYQRFIDRERLENTEEVRMQWTAAMMVYALARYGGELDVSYRSHDARASIRTADDSEVEVPRQEISGRFRHLLRDIVRGASFADPRSRQSFGTFGDCDEIALLMAQLTRGLCEPNELDLDPMIYRVEKGHASLMFLIGGRRYVFDPSASHEESPRSLRSEFRRLLISKGTPQRTRKAIRRSLRMMREGQSPSPLFADRYEESTAQRYTAILEQAEWLWPSWQEMSQEERDDVRREVRLPVLSVRAQEGLESAIAQVSARHPPGHLRIQRERRRRAWGHRADASIYRVIRNTYLPAAMEDPELRQQAIDTMAELMAASLPGRYEENLEMVGAAFDRMPEAERMESIRRLLRVAERRGIRLAMRGIRER